MNQLVAEYKACENELREILESKYNYSLIQNDMVQAYEVLGQLMAYKLISLDDPRIEKNNKSFTKFGIDRDHRFHLDYRTDSGYIPKWLFGNLAESKVFQINTIKHKGVRNELGYIGYTYFQSHALSIRASLCTSKNEASKAAMALCNDYKDETSRTMQTEPLMTLVKEGVCRVYKFTCKTACISAYKDLGTAIINAEGTGISIKIMPNYNSILGLWLPVQETCMAFANMLQKMVNAAENQKATTVNLIAPFDNAIERQTNLYAQAEELGN